jgi:GxxExxY protein
MGGARRGIRGAVLDAMPPPAPSADALNRITSLIIGAAIQVHRALGPGLLEAAYLPCLCYELSQQGLKFELEKHLPLVYKDVKLACAYRADIAVEGQVLVELKAVDVLAPIHSRKMLTYLKLGSYRVGLILNFGALRMITGIERVVNDFPEK